MEEKKLTDEEMINRLELYARGGIWWDGIVEMHDILDLIYRLQDEKQKVVQDYYCEAQHCDVQKDIIEKQKAEIERLTEERDVYLDDCSAVRHKLRQEIEEKFELQKQVDELKGKLYKSKQDMLVYHSNQMQQTVKDTAKEILQGFNKWLKQAISDSYEIAVLNSGGFHGGRNRAFHEVEDLVKKVAESKGVEVE